MVEHIASAMNQPNLDALETILIAQYDCIHPNGYNMAKGKFIRTNVNDLGFNEQKQRLWDRLELQYAKKEARKKQVELN